MKKVINFFLISTLALLTVLITTSCSNMANIDDPASQNDPQNKEYIGLEKEQAMHYIGDVSQIYTSGNSSRFYTGQHIRHFWGMSNDIEFEGNLIAYNSLNPKITEYVKTVQKENNALMHQNYPDATYDKSKEYVELSSYTDVENGKVVMYEIRIFYGNFLETWKDEFWYAKSIMFSPDFKIDINNNVNIETGEKEYYQYPYAKYNNESFNPENFNTIETSKPDQYVEKFGTINKIYENKLKDGIEDVFNPIEEWYSNDEDNFYKTYLIEYNDLNNFVKEYINSTSNKSSFRESYNGVAYDDTKYYMEYIVYTGAKTNKINFYELRVRNNDGYVKNISFKLDQFQYFISAIDNNNSLEDFSPLRASVTEKMKNLGKLEKTYDRPYACSRIDSKKSYVDSRLFEYTSFSDKANRQYNEIADSDTWGMWNNYNNSYDDKKRYIEVLTYMDRKTNKIKFYEFRFKEPTGCDAHGFELSQEQFDSFTDPTVTKLPSVSNILDSVEEYTGPVAYKDAIQKLGKINKIYTAKQYYERFYTGQKIRHYHNMTNNVEFEGNLIEYNSFSPDFEKYFNTLEKHNCCFHQGYDGAKYDPSKKYIEVACYKDMDNGGEIINYELRVFYDDFTNYNSQRMGICFDLSPDLTVDINRWVNIKTGKPVNSDDYKYKNAKYRNTYFDSSKYELKTTSTPDEYISKLGTIANIYKYELKAGTTDAYEPIEEWYSDEEDNKFDCYLVEFNSLNNLVYDYNSCFNGRSSFRRDYPRETFVYGKIYAEYIVYTGVDSKKVNFYELRIKNQDDTINKLTFSTSLFYKLISDIDTNKSLEDFSMFRASVTERMKTLGEFYKVYDNDSICSNREEDNYYYDSRLFEYKSLSEKALAEYEKLVENDKRTGHWWRMWNNYNNNYKDDLRYIELIAKIEKDTNKIIDYELRFKEPTGYEAHGVNMSEEQFNSFTSN